MYLMLNVKRKRGFGVVFRNNTFIAFGGVVMVLVAERGDSWYN